MNVATTSRATTSAAKFAMTKSHVVSASLMLAAVALVAHVTRADGTGQWRTSYFDHVLGTSLELKFETRTAEDAAVAEKAALAEIDRLAAILSGYDASSEFSRWLATRNEPVRISPELLEVLALFDTWRERTSGAVDAAAEAAGRLWQNAAQRQQPPSAAELEEVVTAARQTHWRIDRAQGSATHLTATPLRLNSFAKSYIIDHACTAALQTGKVTTAVVNIGGDLVIRGRSADTVAIMDPAAAAENDEPLVHVTVRDRAVATSGDYRRGVTIGGKWFSHLVDPRSARPVDHVRSATVSSPSATDAGALATALCVMSPAQGVQLARTFADTEYLIVLADGTQVTSSGWRNLAPQGSPDAARVHGAVASSSVSDEAVSGRREETFEVLVNLEVASISGGRTRRPFVAVWIEDKDNLPVRTVGLWFKGARWLPDLRSWSRAEQMRSMAEPPRSPESIASATRGPGKYALRWDGTDDVGKRVPPGQYTVIIEVAREHGTHQLVSGKIDASGPSTRVELPSNAELATVSLEFHAKSTR
jgi:thiamine biosynthesis lipoprotein ApbE